jgi:hypothetical protein
MARYNSKTGVELSVNTMIIVVLALLALIILAFLLIRSVDQSNTATACTSHGGVCQDAKSDCPADNPTPAGWSCGSNQKCCAKSII